MSDRYAPQLYGQKKSMYQSYTLIGAHSTLLQSTSGVFITI